MSKVKWGVIGAGGIADRRTIPGMMLAKNAELVAVMEVNKELAEKIRAKYNAKRAYDNVDDLLADEEVQAENKYMDPIYVDPSDSFAILGKVIGLFRRM
jgi:predicted dehydrogenase